MAEAGYDMATYLPEAQTAYETGIKVLQDMTGWNKIESPNEDIRCYRRPNEETNFDTFKADFVVEKAPEAVANYLYANWEAVNTELSQEDLDGAVIKLADMGDKAKVIQGKLKGAGPFQPRQITNCLFHLDLGSNTHAFAGVSVPSNAAIPEGCCEGRFRYFLQLMEPVAGDATRTNVQVVGLFDPQGSMPAALINGLLGRRAVFYGKLREKLHAEA
jgi:hypothetical protein